MRHAARYALIVAAAVALSCKGPAGPTGPQGFDPAPRSTDIAQTNRFPDAEIKPGSIRLTNTSGGRVLILGTRDDPKPAIVSWEWAWEIDENEDAPVCVQISGFVFDEGTPHGSKSRNEGSSRQSWLTECFDREQYESGRVAVSLYNDVPSGLWREVELTVLVGQSHGFGGFGVEAESDPVLMDVYSPYPEDVIFHPVVVDPFEQENELAWLRSQVDRGRDVLREAAKHMPAIIRDFKVGDPILLYDIDKDTDLSPAGSVTYRALKEMNRRHYTWYRGGILDFHVAVISPAVREDWPNTEGNAGQAGSWNNSITNWYGIGGTFKIDAPIWHEIGHNLGMGHVPGCGDPNQIEDEYPGLDAHINVDGYRVSEDGEVEVMHADEYSDIMSYCWPKWISAYTYRKMAEYRLGIVPTLEALRPVVVQ